MDADSWVEVEGPHCLVDDRSDFKSFYAVTGDERQLQAEFRVVFDRQRFDDYADQGKVIYL